MSQLESTFFNARLRSNTKSLESRSYNFLLDALGGMSNKLAKFVQYIQSSSAPCWAQRDGAAITTVVLVYFLMGHTQPLFLYFCLFWIIITFKIFYC